MNTLKFVFGIVGGLIALVAIVFGLQYAGMVGKGIFAPWSEEINRKVEVESRRYQDGAIQNMNKLRVEYYSATNPAAKAAIAASAKHMASQIGYDDLPLDIQNWINTL